MVGEPYKSKMAKTNGKLAKKTDEDKKAMNEFFYWLGYFNGQQSVCESKEASGSTT